MRRALSVFGVLLLGTAGVVLYRSSAPSIAQAEMPRSAEESELKKQVEELRAELRALSAERERSVQAPLLPASSAAPGTPKETGLPAKLRLDDVVAGMPSEQREAYVHKLQKLETKRRLELTEAELAAEPRDAALQTRVETEARAKLDAGEFPTTRISSVECGNTLCKIEVDQESPAEHHDFGGRFSLDYRTFAVRRGGEDDEPGERRGWTLFVTTPGRRLPRPGLEELVALLPPERSAQGSADTAALR